MRTPSGAPSRLFLLSGIGKLGHGAGDIILMRSLVQLTAIVGFVSGAVLVGGAMLFSQVSLLVLLALFVVLSAVILSVVQGFRLLDGAPLRKGSSATAPRAGAALPR